MVSNSHKNPVVCLRHLSRGRVVFTLFVLFAFALQSFAIQTHIHFPSTRFAGASESLAVGRIVPSASILDLAKDTKDGNAAHCPLCQAVLLGGYYVIPAAVQIYLPFVYAAQDLVGGIAVFTASSPSHAWHSRAPPSR